MRHGSAGGGDITRKKNKKSALSRHRSGERTWRETDGAFVGNNSYRRALIDSLPEGMKDSKEGYESWKDVRGERGRNKTTQGCARPAAPPRPLPLHTKQLNYAFIR